MAEETDNGERTEEAPAEAVSADAESKQASAEAETATDPPPEDAATETVSDESAAEAPAAAVPDEPAAEAPAAAVAEDSPEEAPAEAEAPTSVPAAPEPSAAPSGEPAAAATTGSQPEEARRKKKRLPRAQRTPKTRPQRERATSRKPIVRGPQPESNRGRRQERRGVVVSNAMDKTIVVKVDVIKSHPRYKKVVRRSVKFHAHDEGNAANVGDVVRIVETRPLSATKHWRLAEIVEAAR